MLLLAICFASSRIKLADDFILGGDLSLLPQYQDAKAVFKDINGKDVDPLPFLRSGGLNYVRCRIFVNPSLNTDTGQDLDYVVAFARKVRQEGLKFLLDFHYSDSWADPGQQTKPSAWKNLAANQLPSTLYTYTKSVLTALKDAGLSPDSIQVGNEITNGMLWPDARIGVWGESADNPTNWALFTSLLNQGTKACREVCPGAKIVIHTEKSGDADTTQRYYNRMKSEGIDYDVIGLSYYPFWHGGLSLLGKTLSMLSQDFSGKEVWIAEVAYAYNSYGVPSDSKYTPEFPATADGQASFTREFLKTVKQHSQVKGVFWWFPEETYSPNRRITNPLHRGLWSNVDGKALPALYEYLNL